MIGATGQRKTFSDIVSLLDTIQNATDGHQPTAKTALTHSVARDKK